MSLSKHLFHNLQWCTFRINLVAGSYIHPIALRTAKLYGVLAILSATGLKGFKPDMVHQVEQVLL